MPEASERELIERYGAGTVSVVSFGYLLQSLDWALEMLAEAPDWLLCGDMDQAMARVSHGHLARGQELLELARHSSTSERTDDV